MMGWYGASGMGSFGWFGMGFMGFLWFALILLVIWLVVRLLPRSGSAMTRNTGESALEILDRRLANGQIDFEPWQAQRAAILSDRGDRK